MESYNLGIKSDCCNEVAQSVNAETQIEYPSLHIGSQYNKKSNISIPLLNNMKVGDSGKAEISFVLKTIAKGEGNEYVLQIKEIIFDNRETKKNRITDISNALKGGK